MKLLKKVAAIFLAVVPIFILASCNKNKDVSYVTVEINPGVELVLDAKGNVKSANGLNDDGETLLVDVKLDGKSLDAALEVIVKEAEKTGYLVNAEIENPLLKKEISISVSSTNDKIEADLNIKVESKIDELIENFHLNAVYKKLETKTREYFEEIVVAYDPTLEGKVKELDNETLMQYVELATIEKAQIASKELEQYYQAFKDYQYQLAYKEEIVAALEKHSSLITGALGTMANGLGDAVSAIEKHQYDLFANPDSEYLKLLAELDELKDKVLELKLSLTVNGADIAKIEAQIKVTEASIEKVKAAIQTIMNAYNQSLETLKKALNTAKSTLETAIKEIDGIDYNKILTDYEKEVNDLKNQVLTKFEEAHKDEYAAAKAKVEARKNALLEMVNNK